MPEKALQPLILRFFFGLPGKGNGDFGEIDTSNSYKSSDKVR
jgi:hypothetical protein